MQRRLLPECYHEDDDSDNDDDDEDDDDDDDDFHHVVEDGRSQGQCVAEGVSEQERKTGLLIMIIILVNVALVMMELRMKVMMTMVNMSMLTGERRMMERMTMVNMSMMERRMMSPPC